jgi:hypothetical protein
MKDKDARVRLEAAKYYTARRMGWKETNVNEQVGKDGGPIETKDVSAIDVIRARIAGVSARLGTGSDSGDLSESEAEQLQYDWSFYARPNQLLPAGNWLTWLLLAGR